LLKITNYEAPFFTPFHKLDISASLSGATAAEKGGDIFFRTFC
jgi:hypothetical protein